MYDKIYLNQKEKVWYIILFPKFFILWKFPIKTYK